MLRSDEFEFKHRSDEFEFKFKLEFSILCSDQTSLSSSTDQTSLSSSLSSSSAFYAQIRRV